MTEMKKIETAPIRGETDVVVVGAGFSGLYLIQKLRGMGMSVQVLEAGSNVGVPQNVAIWQL